MNVQRIRLARAFFVVVVVTFDPKLCLKGAHIFFTLSNDEEKVLGGKEGFLVVVDVLTDAVFVLRYLACKSNQSDVHFFSLQILNFRSNKKKGQERAKQKHQLTNQVPLYIIAAVVGPAEVTHLFHSRGESCFRYFFLIQRAIAST